MAETFSLDHAVISVRDRMDEAADRFTRLGFTLTPRGLHRSGSVNHLMVFGPDYLELIGFPPTPPVRPDLVDSPIGLDGLVLSLGDPSGVYEHLRSIDVPVDPPQPLSRPLELDGRTEDVRFTTVRLPRGAIEGGRLYFCHHHTPQFIWRNEWREHENGARSITRFTIAVPDPLASARRYATILGQSAPIEAGAPVILNLGHALLELETPKSLRMRLGALAPDALDSNGKPRETYMAMVTIKTDSLAAAERAAVHGGFRPVRTGPINLAIAARDAMNCTIMFEEM